MYQYVKYYLYISYISSTVEMLGRNYFKLPETWFRWTEYQNSNLQHILLLLHHRSDF